MFDTDVAKLGEIVLRVVIIYLGLLVMLRVAGRRTLSDITPLDMLVMLLVSETVSPALTDGEDSVTAGLVAALTLVVVSVGASWLQFHHRGLERAMSGSPAVLIKDGTLDEDVLRKYRVTNEDLLTALHEKGVLSVAEVKRAFIEGDGKITIIKAEG